MATPAGVIGEGVSYGRTWLVVPAPHALSLADAIESPINGALCLRPGQLVSRRATGQSELALAWKRCTHPVQNPARRIKLDHDGAGVY